MNDDFKYMSGFSDGEASAAQLLDLETQLIDVDEEPHAALLYAIGSFGDDALAHRLSDRLISSSVGWSDESVELALSALSHIGTRGALSQLQFIAWRSDDARLMQAAHAEFKRHADEKGVRVWEIEDEVVPTCGLEFGETPRLEAGTEEFRICLDESFEPYLARPFTPERHVDLPHELAVQHPETARRWRTIRANLEDAVSLQIRRLERVLQTQQRWTSLDWNQYVFEHPLMALLGQRLVWGHYSRYGKLHGTFRIDEEFALRGGEDALYEWPDEEFDIGPAHPHDMSDELVAAWSSLLADYEIVTLVPQFDRPLRRPEGDARKSTSAEFNYAFDADWFWVWLYSHGWQRERHAWGWGACHKVFRTADLLVRLHVEKNDEIMILRSASFHRFLGYPQHSLQLRDVPPVVYSEALNEVDRMHEAFHAQMDSSTASRGT